MAKHVRYTADFYDRNDRRYRINILQDVDSDISPEGWPSPVTLAADPVTIEWSEVSKLDPVQGSSATLKLVSITDRQFFDMYTVEYGSIELQVFREPGGTGGALTTNRLRLDGFTVRAQYPVASDITVSAKRYNAEGAYIGVVSSVLSSGESETTLFAIEGQTLTDFQISGKSRDSVYRYHTSDMLLYWAGTLDPELFEEPYSYNDRYITELSFVDLSPLEYINWDGRGMVSMRSIIEKCVEAAKFNTESPYVEMIATKAGAGGGSVLDCEVLSENFYDDDGEAMTLREVLEEVLRPFALRLLQKDGSVIIFDLQSLSAEDTENLKWMGTDSVIEADRVYNNISVKLSPFHNETILEATIDPDEVLKEGDEGVVSYEVPGWSDGFYGYGNLIQGTLYQHTAWKAHMKKGPIEYGNLKIKNNAWMFRVEPVYSGQKEGLIVWSHSVSLPNNETDSIPWPNYKNTNNPFCAMGANYAGSFPETPVVPIIETKGVYVSNDSSNALILVELEAMYDARYDWFNPADAYKTSFPFYNYNYAGNEEYIKQGGLCFIPVVITLRDANGAVKYRYMNGDIRTGIGSKGAWYSVSEGTDVYASPSWLAYYADQIRSQGAMSSGWQTNKRVLDPTWNTVPLTYTTKNEGEYIPIPPESGYLVVEVCAGHLFMKLGSSSITAPFLSLPNTDPIYTYMARTVAYKSVTIKLVAEYGYGELPAKDIEDVAWLNKSARETLEINTIVGTPPEKMPAAFGVLRFPSGGQVTSLARGEHFGRAEKLLIGTAYSQYANRKNVLSGEVELLPFFQPLSDESISGRYVLLNELQSLEKSTSRIKAAEFIGDIYDSIEEK